MNFYTWLTINEDRIAEQEIMLGRPLRRAQLEHLYHLEYAMSQKLVMNADEYDDLQQRLTDIERQLWQLGVFDLQNAISDAQYQLCMRVTINPSGESR